MSLPKSIDIPSLKRQKRISFYFRYPLYHSEFREVRVNSHLHGYYVAKPLYGKLTQAGRVDRSGEYNGQIAVLFIPSPARSAARAELLLTRIPKNRVTLANGKRNWRAIHQAAERAIFNHLKTV